VAKVADLPSIEVRMRPRHQMAGLSGFTCWDEVRARWVVTINRNNVEGRRRFTLAHEFKHILDHARDAPSKPSSPATTAAP
jgi:Zn-dependent peptidase ImmA (M78 family)